MLFGDSKLNEGEDIEDRVSNNMLLGLPRLESGLGEGVSVLKR